jgi:2-oxoisovalerate dehydrogenase E1 component beta subunit
MTGAERIRSVLAEALAQSDTVQVLGEAVSLSPATTGLMADHPAQVHLLPAADATLVGVAVGMAIAGKRPVVELAHPAALWGALQQLGQEAAAIEGEFSAPVIVRVPIMDGETTHPPLTEIRGLTVASPSSPEDAGAMLSAALKARGPVVILEPRTVLAAKASRTVPEISLGKAAIVREGRHATVLAWGEGVQAAFKAATILAREGIEVEVVDLRTLTPLDTDTIGASVQRTGRVIVVGGETTALLTAVRVAFLQLESPPVHAVATATDVVAKVRASVQF